MPYGYLILNMKNDILDLLEYKITVGKTEYYYEMHDEDAVIIQAIDKVTYDKIKRISGITGKIPLREKTFCNNDLKDSIVYIDNRLGKGPIIVSRYYDNVLKYIDGGHYVDITATGILDGEYATNAHNSVSNKTLFNVIEKLTENGVPSEIVNKVHTVIHMIDKVWAIVSCEDGSYKILPNVTTNPYL